MCSFSFGAVQPLVDVMNLRDPLLAVLILRDCDGGYYVSLKPPRLDRGGVHSSEEGAPATQHSTALTTGSRSTRLRRSTRGPDRVQLSGGGLFATSCSTWITAGGQASNGFSSVGWWWVASTA